MLTAVVALVAVAEGACPFAGRVSTGAGEPMGAKNAAHEAYVAGLGSVDWEAVRADIGAFLRSSQASWPADYGNYGPLFVRLAWHSSGSYRTSDGRGGVDGARQRFDPERSWDDNVNLDKARSLLYSVKREWPQISWGDLIVLTGNVAIEEMGGPRAGFCPGRVDDADGEDSLLLGPTEEQAAYAPCEPNGNCTTPLGTTTIGLIYLNPQGPMGEPNPGVSAGQIRDSFGRMAMNDSETIALIGGGHAFGKTHGACPDGPGPSPQDNPSDPWPGLCGAGSGVDAYTSGIEGPWTTHPTRWDNEYFQFLRDYDWQVYKGPGDAWQWRPLADENPTAPSADGAGRQPTMMMTSDVALKTDEAYAALVDQFASDIEAHETAFAAAWYKLTTRDMGPAQRCADNPDLPPPQAFQYPLPPSTTNLTNVSALALAIDEVFLTATPVSLVFRLAWSCASTFRATDYLGGCNGARLRFPPAKDWPTNAGLDQAWDALAPLKKAYPVSWADLVVLAGNRALRSASAAAIHDLPFCDGRSDATDGEGDEYLAPTLLGGVNETAADFKEAAQRSGLSIRDYVALLGARRSLGAATPPFHGNFTLAPEVLDNAYFNTLIDETWLPVQLPTGDVQYAPASGAPIVALTTDLNCLYDAELLALVQQYAADNDLFLADLSRAWTALLNADRFDKPSCLPSAP